MAAKILLVEDDKSLREIYAVRLQAEGYDIAAASDGEQALAMAIKERPGLIITDVMMPKISGFDMLDILRSTTETKDIKVIMMTALSSDDQRSRGERMGADRYLVKSQVGIEDVVRTVHEVLGDSGTAASPAPVAPAAAAPVAPAAPTAAPASNPVVMQTNLPDMAMPGQPAPAPVPAVPAVPAAMPASAPAAPVMPAPAVVTDQPSSVPLSASAPAITTSHAPVAPQTSTIPEAPSAKQRIIQPLTPHVDDKVDINELLDKELAKEAGLDMLSRPQVASTDQEKATIESQLQASVAPAGPVVPEPVATTPPVPAPMPTPVPAEPASQVMPTAVPAAPAPAMPTDRPAAPTIPQRNTTIQTPPRIPTI